MESTQLHIDQAFCLYEKLVKYQSDFVCRGIDNFLCSTIFKGNKLACVIFYYLYENLPKIREKIVANNSIQFKLPERYSSLCFDLSNEKLQIKSTEGNLVISALGDEKLLSLILNTLPSEAQKVELIKLEDQLNLISKFFEDRSGDTQPSLLPLTSSKSEERNSERLKNLFQYAEKTQDPKTFQRWYSEGIENISCKIFNEFVLSFTSAEYLRITNFTDKLGEFKTLLSYGKFDREIEIDENIPQLVHTIVVMAARYQLFCRQVESQLIRKPEELYFGLTRDIETELESTLPILGLGNYKVDSSKKFARLFASILDVGFIDHRFILEQITIERLIYALEIIKNTGEESFNITSWEINADDAHRLENIEQHYVHERIGATKLVLKLVYAKACTLWGKIHSFLKTSSDSESTLPFPAIKIIDRTHIQTPIEVTYDYSGAIETIKEQDNEQLGLNHACHNDMDRFNRQVTYIRMNHLWFKEKEERFKNYKKLMPENVVELYKEYRSRKQGRNTENIIFFSDKFLVAALSVISKDIEMQLSKIGDTHIEPSDVLLKKVNSSIKLFRDLIEEMKKLAEFSEKFGLMKDQHLFENSFYAPNFNFVSTERAYLPVKFERKIYDRDRKRMQIEIKSNWLFIASTHYPPAYPNHYKRLYEKYDDKRREYSAMLYMELPSFLNRNTRQDIAKERNNSIQIMAIFATIMAFVTASVGALKILETSEGYAHFACIFTLSLLAFVAIIRLFSQVNNNLLFKIIGLALCVLSLNLTKYLFVQLFFCLIIYCIINHELHYTKGNKKDKTKKDVGEKGDNHS